MKKPSVLLASKVWLWLSIQTSTFVLFSKGFDGIILGDRMLSLVCIFCSGACLLFSFIYLFIMCIHYPLIMCIYPLISESDYYYTFHLQKKKFKCDYI